MKLILGTMTFGESVFMPEVKTVLKTYFDRGGRMLDTAFVYNEGVCETLLGEAMEDLSLPFSVATKVNPRISGRLDDKAVRHQATESLKRLRRESADLLYLHFPDPNTPVESALYEVGKLYDEGKIKAFGLSNFPAWMVANVWHICDRNGYVLPSVYEGIYNPLTRRAEEELNACLKAFGMCFFAYNPLAGGLLTGRYTSFDEAPGDGRFTHRPNYRNRYWKKSLFEAMEVIRDAAAKEGETIAGATLRYLAHHSMLSEARGDGIILGASRVEHLTQNMDAVERGALSEEMLLAFEKAWQIAKGDSPAYFTLFQKKPASPKEAN